MSRLLVTQNQVTVEKIMRYGGSKQETSICKALAQLTSLLSMKTLTLMLKSSDGKALQDYNTEHSGIPKWSQSLRGYLWVLEVPCSNSSQALT